MIRETTNLVIANLYRLYIVHIYFEKSKYNDNDSRNNKFGYSKFVLTLYNSIFNLKDFKM